MDGDTGHIKMTRVFRTSIITQLNKIKKNFLAPNMGARRGEQGGAVAPPWKIFKKKSLKKKCTNKIF